jgi:hypothetical protein
VVNAKFTGIDRVKLAWGASVVLGVSPMNISRGGCIPPLKYWSQQLLYFKSPSFSGGDLSTPKPPLVKHLHTHLDILTKNNRW